MSRLMFTPHEYILDSGKELWPPRDRHDQQTTWLWDALDTLTIKQLRVVEAIHYEELSFEQYGIRAGISKQAAHQLYNRAISALREELTREY